MMCDTGAFSFNSNRPVIYEYISRLLAKGIDKDQIYRNVFWTASEARLRLQGYLLYVNMKVLHERHTAIITLTNEERRRFKVKNGDTEGIVNIPLTMFGTKLSVFINEDTEHPGTMTQDDYDLAGFSVGIVDRASILKEEDVKPGDLILGLPSSGIHSNGYSLVRKVFDVENSDLGRNIPEVGKSLGDILLTPTKIYVKPVLAALETGGVHGISHITGGGFYENIPRCIPKGLCAVIERNAVPVPDIFRLIQAMGNIPERDMFNTFNMGIGMSLVVSQASADRVIELLPDAVLIGRIEENDERIRIC